MKHKNDKLTFGTKIAYGAGDIYGGGAIIMIGVYYLYFLTDVVNISPAMAGLVILLSKIWDAVSDPLMGVISDRTRTRFGRRRPYFLAGIIFIFLSTFMLWYPVDFSNEFHRFLFVCLSYIFFSTVITMVMIPYTALASELSLDYGERTSLVTVRMWFSGLSALVCAAVPMEIVKYYKDIKTGYIVMALFLGVFFALPWIATFLFTHERHDFQKAREHINLKKTFKMFFEPFKIRSFRNVLMVYVFTFVAMDIVMALIIYYLTYYLNRGDQTNYLFATLFIVKSLFLPGLYLLSKKIDKKRGYIFFCVLWFLTMLGSLAITPGTSTVYLYLFSGFVGIFVGGIGVLAYSIFPDIPDVDELFSGRRREGIYSGLFTFARKVCQALVLFLLSAGLEFSGYRAPVKRTIDGVSHMVQQEQSDKFILILRVVFVAAPFIFLFVSLFNIVRYPLSHEVHERLKKYLKLKRSRRGSQEFIKEEKKFLWEKLV